LIAIIILIIIIIIITIAFVVQMKHKKDLENIAKVSFTDDNEEKGKNNLLANE